VKEKLLQTLTDTAVEVTGMAKSFFFVSISELADDSVAAGGETVAELKSALEK
jgi:phenylpyruvate tautomerase PptA (4-oxalocrotonate tautomerase family)